MKTKLEKCPMCGGRLVILGVSQVRCNNCFWWIPCDNDGNVWIPDDLTVNGEMHVEPIMRVSLDSVVAENAKLKKEKSELQERICACEKRLTERNGENQALREQISSWKAATGWPTPDEARSCRERFDKDLDILVRVSDILEEWGAT